MLSVSDTLRSALVVFALPRSPRSCSASQQDRGSVKPRVRPTWNVERVRAATIFCEEKRDAGFGGLYLRKEDGKKFGSHQLRSINPTAQDGVSSACSSSTAAGNKFCRTNDNVASAAAADGAPEDGLCYDPDFQSADDFIHSGHVVVFLKGTLEKPQCHFSAQFVKILKQVSPGLSTQHKGTKTNKSDSVADDFELLHREGVPTTVYNILLPDLQWLRSELKTREDGWPTFPVLFVDGFCVGGLDVVKDLARSNRLEAILKDSTALQMFLEERELKKALEIM
ncbi:unnamed protein product [Amoebophrya sp. A120]|nr:unnamed protein product [Amoebophrya sp. A120]|eukprot:GSA120T00011853001.1